MNAARGWSSALDACGGAFADARRHQMQNALKYIFILLIYVFVLF